MNLFRALILVSLLSLCGCTSLRIQVGVLNPEVVRELAQAERLDRVMPEIATEHDVQISARFKAVQNEHYKAYAKVAQTYSQELAKLGTDADGGLREALGAAVRTHAQMSPRILGVYTDTETTIKASTSSLRGLWAQYKSERDKTARAELQRQILWLLDERDNVLKGFAHTVRVDMQELQGNVEKNGSIGVAARLQALGFIQQQVAPATTAALTKLMDSGGLEHSPYAYYVAKADDTLWAAEFDDTVARGFFGNSDIAIKAIGPTNFTIKGVSFNPADVAATASRVTTQTVVLAAQIAGVPVKLSGAPTDGQQGGALAKSSTGLSSLLEANTQTSQAVRAQRESLLRIAAAILREKESIVGPDADRRREALDAIVAVYESHASRLRVTPASNGD